MSHAAYDPTTCNLCGSRDSVVVLDLPAPSMASDGRIIDEPLHKVECAGCGLVRNGSAIDERRLAAHYDSYALGLAAATSEVLFFTPDGVKPRSQVIFDWLRAGVAAVSASTPSSVLEIGCGEGSALARFAGAWPSSAVAGLDLSGDSVRVAQSKGLAVNRGSYRDVVGTYDLIYSFAVIEHVPSPADFFATLRDRLTPDGLLMMAQPCQDCDPNDVFLTDHLHHFTSHHISEYGRRAGLLERFCAVGQPLIPDFSLHVFGLHGAAVERAAPVVSDIRHVVRKWQAVFTRVNRWLDEVRGRPVAVWGLGQTFQMLSAYSRLRDSSITIGLDDNPARFAGRVAFPVSSLESAALEPGAARVLLTFVPGPSVVARLRARGAEWFSPLEELPA